jgi:hypothetical protein
VRLGEKPAQSENEITSAGIDKAFFVAKLYMEANICAINGAAQFQRLRVTNT